MLGSIAILVIGLLLVYSEFFLPGGVMGTVGGILIVVSTVVFASNSNGILPALLFIVLALLALAGVIRLALWRIQQAAPEHSVFLRDDQAGFVASRFDQEVVGQDGEAVSDLKPSGHVLVSGKRYQAVSQSGYVTKGTAIRVTGGRSAYLTVKSKNKET